MNPAKNANDDYVGDDDIFVNIFYIFEHDNDVIKLFIFFKVKRFESIFTKLFKYV